MIPGAVRERLWIWHRLGDTLDQEAGVGANVPRVRKDRRPVVRDLRGVGRRLRRTRRDRPSACSRRARGVGPRTPTDHANTRQACSGCVVPGAFEHDPNGVYAGIGRDAMLRHMVNLRQLGARALLYGEDGEDHGVCHLPMPVEAGDLAAVDGAIFRIVGRVDGIPFGHAIDALVVVRSVRLPVAAR